MQIPPDNVNEGDEWEIVSEDEEEEEDISDSTMHDSSNHDAPSVNANSGAEDSTSDIILVSKIDISDDEKGIGVDDRSLVTSDSCFETSCTKHEPETVISATDNEPEGANVVTSCESEFHQFDENEVRADTKEGEDTLFVDVSKSDACLDTSYTEVQTDREIATDNEACTTNTTKSFDGNSKGLKETQTLINEKKISDKLESQDNSHSKIQDAATRVHEENQDRRVIKDEFKNIGRSFQRVGKTVQKETMIVAESVRGVAATLVTETKQVGENIRNEADKIHHAVKHAVMNHDIKGKAKSIEDTAMAAALKMDVALKTAGDKVKSFNDKHNVLDTLAVAALIGAGIFLTKGNAPTGTMLLATGGAAYAAGEAMRMPSFPTESFDPNINQR